MKLSEIKKTLLAEIFAGGKYLDIMVDAGVASDLMSDILRGPTNGTLLLTGLNNVQVVRTAVIAGLPAVVIARAKRPTQEMIALAEDHGVALLATPFTLFSACGRLFSKGLRGIEKKAA